MNEFLNRSQDKKFRLLVLAGWILLSILIWGCGGGGSDSGGSPTGTTPETAYHWPSTDRAYWPTDDWQTASMEDHGIHSGAMGAVDSYAAGIGVDALLIVKDGYIVFEKYYTGDKNTSTELWSATKSFTSTLVGIAIDKGYIDNVNQLMTEFMPEHDFGNITIKHVLTQKTGLEWSERDSSWWNWVSSPDWNAEALSRTRFAPPGTYFLYSTANSHFLSHLVSSSTGMATGDFANEYLFKPLGINFTRLSAPISYSSWDNYMVPLGKTTWQQDVQGYEIGGVGLYLTAREMAKLGFLYINKGHWDGQVILSEAYIDEAIQPYNNNVDPYYGVNNYGYQWWIASYDIYRFFEACGSGGQTIAVVPSLDMIVVIKCKPFNASEARDKIQASVYGLVPMIINAAN